ncbi:MAG: exodeoxyribonuclease V subunit alpha [Acidimicrobiales bacterium]|nr:exodeoxyribonuclease V subunit alpha [Acidimicrobiales bacterium]
MTARSGPGVDAHGARRTHRDHGRLGPFCDATVLDSADVHVATTLARLAGDDEQLVALGAAFSVRAVRHGSVVVDLATIAETAVPDEDPEIDVGELPWPDPDEWVTAMTASTLVAPDDDLEAVAPLRQSGSSLMLDRYWHHERRVADDLRMRVEQDPGPVDRERLRHDLDRLFDDPAPDLQRLAAANAVLRSCSVVAGGPGTGKTTTVARILAVLHGQQAALSSRRDAGGAPLRVALAAPTGKAAARLQEAIHSEIRTLPVEPAIRDEVLGLQASTLHRLLGWRPDNHSRFRHDRHDPLPHNVVIVDETSMVSLNVMSRLLEAVRLTARVILVGDPQQLTSIEAGAVLADVVGPARDGLRLRSAAAEELTSVTGQPVEPTDEPEPAAIGDGVVVLRHVHRFRGALAELAGRVERGDSQAAVDLLSTGADDVHWVPADVAGTDVHHAATVVRDAVLQRATQVVEAARAGDADTALTMLRDVQVLCAHRRGAHGAARWRAQIEHWLVEAMPDYRPHGWYAGRPLLVTANDRELDLYNGDIGVAVAGDDGLRCAFERHGEVVLVSPARLAAVETLYAMTIHKSQGSQFGEVVVILPDETSPILTRELLYTAVTRAERAVTLIGTEGAVRAAIARPVSRASGLQHRLWT